MESGRRRLAATMDRIFAGGQITAKLAIPVHTPKRVTPWSRCRRVTGWSGSPSAALSQRSASRRSPRLPSTFELDRRVDLRLVKFDVMKPWITNRVTELLGVEDEVLVAMIFNFLEMDQVHSSGAGIHSQLLTFLDVNTDAFMVELWELLVSATQNASGIPQKFIDEKAAELKRQKEIAEELKKRQRAVEGG